MKAYLIHFTFDYYCQGVEEGTVSYLVYAYSLQEAIRKILFKFPTARGFEQRTIE